MIKDGPEASLQGVFLDLSKSYSSKNPDKLHQCVQFVVIYIRPENCWNVMGCQKLSVHITVLLSITRWHSWPACSTCRKSASCGLWLEATNSWTQREKNLLIKETCRKSWDFQSWNSRNAPFQLQLRDLEKVWYYSSWWFQPICKKMNQIGSIPQSRGKFSKKCLKPTPRLIISILLMVQKSCTTWDV